jgi:LmbE family N-acetylglucosaminyl deacetylase
MQQEDVPGAVKCILVIQAHPDDADISSGGTIARWAREKHEVHYVLCTSGNKGSNDPAMTLERLGPLREQEEQNAADILGVKSLIFLRHEDSELEETLLFRHELARIIRRLQPHVLMTHDPWARYRIHPDHRAVGFTALAAIVDAGNQMIRGEETAWKVDEVFLFQSDQPDHGEDITDTVDLKVAAIRAHASQSHFGEAPQERVYAWARAAGQKYGYQSAEEFKRLVPRH